MNKEMENTKSNSLGGLWTTLKVKITKMNFQESEFSQKLGLAEINTLKVFIGNEKG